MVQIIFFLCCLITFFDPHSAYQPRIRAEINAKSNDFDKVNLFNYYLDWWLPMIDNALHELNQNTNQSQIPFLCKRHVNHVIKSAKKQVPWALKSEFIVLFLCNSPIFNSSRNRQSTKMNQ